MILLEGLVGSHTVTVGRATDNEACTRPADHTRRRRPCRPGAWLTRAVPCHTLVLAARAGQSWGWRRNEMRPPKGPPYWP